MIAEQLAKASVQLDVNSHTVMRHEVHPAAAILDEASARDADLIVVGTRHRRWFDRQLLRSVAAHVVNRAQCSVLVLPLDEPAPAHG